MTLTTRPGQADLARCDECGIEADTVEQRDRHEQRIGAWLPDGWRLIEGLHFCGGCAAQFPERFAAQREAFEARLEQLGTGLAADIAVSLGVPIEIGRGWAADWLAADKRRAA